MLAGRHVDVFVGLGLLGFREIISGGASVLDFRGALFLLRYISGSRMYINWFLQAVHA